MNRASHNRMPRAACAAAVLAMLIPGVVAQGGVSWSGEVDPADPAGWDASTEAYIGTDGSGTLRIDGGDAVVSGAGHLGLNPGSTGEVTVIGEGSTWTVSGDLYVGHEGAGTLTISDDAMVRVGGTLSCLTEDSSINLAAGGALALYGEAADSLESFLALVDGTAIRYWDVSIMGWADITEIGSATYNEDYSLSYETEGDLAGYTVLTVLWPDIPGDANGDGYVDLDDFAMLKSCFGWWWYPCGDFNHDGVVDLDDFVILRRNFGRGIPYRLRDTQQR